MFLLKSPKNYTNACISKGSLKEQGWQNQSVSQSVSLDWLYICLLPLIYVYCLYVSIAYVSIHVYLCICACVYVCMYVVCMYACMYVHINHPCLYGIY